MNAAAWAGLVGVATAALGYLGARYTSRSARRASEYSALMQAPESISSGYDRLNEDLWASLKDERERTATAVEEGNVARRKFRSAIGYIRRLLSLLTQHAPHVPLPQPPPDLSEDVQVEPTQRKDET